VLTERIVKEKYVKYLTTVLKGSRLKGRPKNKWWNCVQTDINRCKITNWKERAKDALRRGRYALNCSAIGGGGGGGGE
jgi:hypothetical protein